MIPNLLRASTLATLAATLLALGVAPGVFADGRADWDDYAWQRITIASCSPDGAMLTCPAYREKWDWKRNQWVEITITLDPASHSLQLTQRLTDNDPHDDDHVCVTALAVDASGQNVIAHHQNWYMRSGTVREEAFHYAADRLDAIATIHIGSKQCRDGATQDDARYAAVLAGLHS